MWIPAILSFLVQVPATVALYRGVHVGWIGHASHASLADVIASIVGPVALLAARRLPGPVVAVAAVAASADIFVGPPGGGPPYVSLAFAIVSAIVRGARVWAWVSVGCAWLGTILLAIVVEGRWTPGRAAATTFGILIVMGIGEAVRTRRERAAAYRGALAQRRQTELQAERVRIARELHDVLAHSLSQINVQAGVGLHLMERQPEKAADALASIKETSKTALEEVRAVLGVLRSEGAAAADAPLVPEPDLARLPGLVASVQAQGLEVALDDRLGGDVPRPLQLAFYRIVQESLTNVLRHAHARRATVELRREGERYVVEIVDDGSGTTGVASEGGRGLLGMRERAELLGGRLEAGPRPGGGFAVRAVIPATGGEEEAP